jgi:ribosomal protein L11 methyltransferase
MTDYGVLEADVSEDSAELWDLWCTEIGASGSEWLSGVDVLLPDGTSSGSSVQQPPLSPGWVRVRHYFTKLPGGVPAEWAEGYQARFPEATAPRRLGWTLRPVEAWGTQWRVHFAPLCIGGRLIICPPWDKGTRLDEGSAAPRLRIVIEPAQGFGTGRHASTVLALELLERCLGACAGPLLPRRMLDVGTGSGILLIAARLLGVAEGWGLDIDARVAPEVRDNLALSGLSRDARLVVGTPASVRGAFPLVTANITAPALTGLAGDLRRLTSPGGHLILSGMLDDEIESVLGAIATGGWRRAILAHAEGWAAAWLTRAR